MTLFAKLWLVFVIAATIIVITIVTKGLLPIMLGIFLLTLWAYGKWVTS